MNEMLSSFLIAFGGNLLSSLVLILGIYHQVPKRPDYLFTFIFVSPASIRNPKAIPIPDKDPLFQNFQKGS